MRERTQPPLSRRERRTIQRTERLPRERTRARVQPRRPAWQSPFLIVSVAALAIGIAIILVNQRPSSNATLVTPPIAYTASQVDGAALGSAAAPVTLDLYADFQCPYCGQFIRDQLAGLKSTFVDTGTLRIVAHDIDIIGSGQSPDESLDLAVGARCAAAQGRYWPFHDYLFWNQKPENAGEATGDWIASVARAVGLDMTAWSACTADPAQRAAVIAETTRAAGLGINQTPTIALNGGRPVAGVPDAASLGDEIRRLAAASGSPGASASPAASGAVP